jgi:hypothetical protein
MPARKRHCRPEFGSAAGRGRLGKGGRRLARRHAAGSRAWLGRRARLGLVALLAGAAWLTAPTLWAREGEAAPKGGEASASPEAPAESAGAAAAQGEAASGGEAASAQPAGDEAGALLDRAAVRFTAPETGGVNRPQFIFERELAFEARLEALADSGYRASAEEPYLERHVRGALERHMAEVLLYSLEITPEPTARELAVRTRSARLTLSQQVGGEAALERASAAEGIAPGEVSRLLTRRARASLYLDRMVATMLTPSDTELRIVHRTTRTPFSGADYESIAPLLQRWYVAQRLNAAVRAFYEGARSRILVTTLTRGAPAERSSAPE